MGRWFVLMVMGTEWDFGTMSFIEIVLTGSELVVEWMVLMFFPAMAMDTLELVLATIFIVHKEGLTLPEWTFLRTVGMVLGWSSEVLPVMAIVTTTLVMFELVERTEDCFEVE